MKKLIMLTLTSALFFSTVMADTFKKNYQEDEFGKFYSYLMQSIQYPNDAKLQNLQGNSIVTFTLLKGNLKQVNIQTALGNGCDVTILNSLMGYERLNMLKDGKYALKTSFRIQGINSAIVNESAKMPIGFTALKTITIIGYPSPNAGNKNNSDSKTINIIGYGTEKEPLYVLDGKVLDIRLKDLDANDIESLTVLKDASAISLYGKEAEHGVIIIKTKKSTSESVDQSTALKNEEEVTVTGYGSKVILRGNKTFGKEPLFILDGKIIENGSINDVEPNKVQTVKILKDASAVALYGSDAHNGVIIITTKKEAPPKTKKK